MRCRICDETITRPHAIVDFCEPCWDRLNPNVKESTIIEKHKDENIEFFNEVEDSLQAIRSQIRYKFPNFNSIKEIDDMMQNMIYTNELLSRVQDWCRK